MASWGPLCTNEKLGPIDLKVIARERAAFPSYDSVREGAILSGAPGRAALDSARWSAGTRAGPGEREEIGLGRC